MLPLFAGDTERALGNLESSPFIGSTVHSAESTVHRRRFPSDFVRRDAFASFNELRLARSRLCSRDVLHRVLQHSDRIAKQETLRARTRGKSAAECCVM